MDSEASIYTIGYSTHSIKSFISLLKANEIQVIADVRSQPYSRYKPEFSQKELKNNLQVEGLQYVFLGRELGARREEPECYIDGRIDYSLVEKTELFKKGIERLEKGMKQYHIALLCAEKDPIGCHRAILISRYLWKKGIPVVHIHDDGTLESHEQLEQRLLALYGRDQEDLFMPPRERLDEVYKIQQEKLAFVREEEMEKYPEIRLVLQEAGHAFQVQFVKKDYTPEVTMEVATEVTTEVSTEVALIQIIQGEMTKVELRNALNLKNDEHFRKTYLVPAIEKGLIEMTIPDKPRSSKQRYRITPKGHEALVRLTNKK